MLRQRYLDRRYRAAARPFPARVPRRRVRAPPPEALLATMLDTETRTLEAPSPPRRYALRRALTLIIQLVVTVGCLALLLRGIGLEETADAFRDADYRWVAPAAIFLVLDLQLRAVRWRMLLDLGRPISHNNLFGASNVGYLVNNILPFRAGEVARVLLIDELEHTGKVRGAASAVSERLLDVVAMVVLLVVLFPFIDEPSWATGPALALGAAVVVGFMMILALSHANDAGKTFWEAPLRRLGRPGNWTMRILDAGLRAMRPMRRWSSAAAISALTAVIWLLAALSFYMMMIAFNVDGGFAAAALVLTATTLSMIVPSSPGYIGVFHAVAVQTLVEVFGVDKEVALTYAFGQHGLIYILPSALGAYFLLTHRQLWHRLVASFRGKDEPTGGENLNADLVGRDA
jgi:uncharacterized protein (TIRG00374 family)